MQQATVILPLSAPAEELMKEAYELQDLIKIGMHHINDCQTRLDSIKEELLAKGVTDAGNYALESKITRSARKVNVARFSERFPTEYTQLIEDEIRRAKLNAGKSINIKDAERLLGKDMLDPVCDLQSTVQHVIVRKQIDGTEEVRYDGNS